MNSVTVRILVVNHGDVERTRVASAFSDHGSGGIQVGLQTLIATAPTQTTPTPAADGMDVEVQATGPTHVHSTQDAPVVPM